MAGFQKKTVAKYISNRINFWAWSLKDKDALKNVLGLSLADPEKLSDEDDLKIKNFQQEVIDSTIVTGGAIASMLLGEEVNDLDIYLNNQATAKKVAEYYLNQMIIAGKLDNDYVSRKEVVENDTNGVAVYIKSMGVVGEDLEATNYNYFEAMSVNELDEFMSEYQASVKIEEAPAHSVKFITSNAITLKNGIQLILRFCGEAETIHENYDFVHATNYWTQKDGVVYRAEALQALLERRLIYVGSKFPVASLFRIRKFLARGFSISAGEITKIAYDVSKLNLDDRRVLHDQLIGVDYAYFSEVLNILRGNSEKPIDRTYLFTILNEVFQEEGGEKEKQLIADTVTFE